MPPAPGRIHPLPIKVLYTIDTSPQSFLAVLPDRHDVYVHPQTQRGELLGSCALKPIARGVCFASPECIPRASSLDFSVYNLDPVAPFIPPNGHHMMPPPPRPANWTGKGFLSWALRETGAGATLTRGRLVREYEFASTAFAAGGGLEGLMAAANAAGNEEDDGKGWGLEVTLTLRQLNPEGKTEFAHRRAFSDLLSGKTPSSAVPAGIASSPGRPTRSSPRHNRDGGFVRPMLPGAKPQSPLSRDTDAGPSRSSAAAKHDPARHRDRDGSPTPTRKSNRHTTPPPRPTDLSNLRTPPAPSPSRAALLSLLKRDGKISPEMVKKLTANNFFQRLLKASTGDSKSPGARPPPSPARRGTTAGGSGIPGIGPLPGAPTQSHTRMGSLSGSEAAVPPSSDAYPWVGTPSVIEACNNCGATTSTGQWMTKKLKDGLHTRVCNSCGVYFNQHKRMRPSDMWDKDDEVRPEAPAVRSSPRLNRTQQHAHAPPPPLPVVAESPRKRPRAAVTPKAGGPTPSPRMATRASARATPKEPGSPTPGRRAAAPLNFATHFPFHTNGNSNSSSHAGSASTSASATPLPTGGGRTGGTASTNPEDLEALFLQFADDEAATTADGNVTLEALFGKEDTEGIMELLKSIEAESSAPPSQA